MADWRDRGFVPDSDDEDEDEEADVETQDTHSGHAELSGSVLRNAGHGLGSYEDPNGEEDISKFNAALPVQDGASKVVKQTSRHPTRHNCCEHLSDHINGVYWAAS
jgi:hypothetical protein